MTNAALPRERVTPGGVALGSTSSETVTYGRLDCRLDHPAAIDHHNRKYDAEAYELDRVGRDATDRFAWCKPKFAEFRQWRTNPLPLADMSITTLVGQLRFASALEPFHERMADRLLGRMTSKPAADEQRSSSASDAGADAAPAAGEETVSDEEAARVADALVGPPVDSPTSRAYCRCGCGTEVSAVHEALRRALMGVSPRAAVEDIAVAYGLDAAAIDSVVEEVEEQLDDARRLGRLAP